MKNKESTKQDAVSRSPAMICSAAAFDLVGLENHTDIYRVYSLPNGEFLFVGQNSDTIRFSRNENVKVECIIKKAE